MVSTTDGTDSRHFFNGMNIPLSITELLSRIFVILENVEKKKVI